MNQGSQDLSSKYTIFPLKNPEHLQKLLNYLTQFKGNAKTSFCRFYLRGLCIMKSQYCKFSHDFDQLDIQNHTYEEVSSMNIPYGDKLLRKKIFIDKQDFYQRPLFFIKDLDYHWLYKYQFTERYKKSGVQVISVKEINKQEEIRNRIRQIMHRQEWDKMMNYLDSTYPNVNYPINFLSLWFGKLGFQKSQTFCKFGDFIRYIVNVRGYVQANIVVPPLTSRSVFFIKSGTLMYQHIQSIKLECDEYRKEVKKIKEERKKKLPQNLEKRFICRFYMSGNCEKTRQECFYVHKIEDLRYDKDIQFEKNYRQPPKSMQERLNYVSLHRYYMSNKKEDEPSIELQQINSKFGLKDKIRKQVHLELYRDFLAKLQEIKGSNALNFYEVKQEYTRFGFNHTDENKFGQLNSCLWQLGYHQEDTVNSKGQKKTFIYKIPPLEQMNQLYFKKISKILSQQINLQELKKGEEDPQILQSSIRRLIYSNTNKQLLEIPLHVYLRKRKSTLKEVIEHYFPQYVPFVFFESSQENFKKLIDLLKKYFKKHKKFIYKMEEIDSFIRGLTKQEINLNNFVNLKGLIQLGLLQLGKQIYFWPMSNAAIIIDRSHSNKDQIPQFFIENYKVYEMQEEWNLLEKEWTVVVDDIQKVKFCKKVMSNCNLFGVDLEGRLCQNGYIDLLQISCRINKKKYIFVIDMHILKRQLFDQYRQIQAFLKEIFQSQNILKIMHSCQQDSIALDYCLGIKIKNVFDTSGVDIYLQQKKVYEEMRQNNHTFQHTLKKIHASKTPGLNQILQKWGAPKGINELKQQMKKVFNQYPRSYFTKRPINQQFLIYSARDVQDLIEVWQNMHKLDPDRVWAKISQFYTTSV